MAEKRAYIELIPSAKRLIGSLRDLGYDFVRAVADVVDNSIQAGATEVKIEMKFDGEYSWVRISDNGKGMTSAEITEAMRFGTKKNYGSNELGKFGLGMKTASISQCRRLTVASRANVENADIEVRRLDLDEIEQSNKWEVTDLPPNQCSPNVIFPLNNTHGTIVFWEFLDRMMKYKLSAGEAAKNGFIKMAGQLDRYIGMVFHRFLSGEINGKGKVTISINQTLVEPWDPFARLEQSTKALPHKEIPLRDQTGEHKVTCSPFILPPQNKLSIGAFNSLSGIKKWNLQQGFYIYRENRMIQSGGWNDIRTSEEHAKLARVALDFSSDMDTLLNVDIKKANIILPKELVDALEPIVADVISQAEAAYRSASHETPKGAAVERRSTTYRRGETHPTITNLREEDTSDPAKVIEDAMNRVVNPESFEAGLDPAIDRLIETIENGTASADVIKDFLKDVVGNTIKKTMETLGRQQIYLEMKQRLRQISPKIADLLGW
jgi:hypothetical protein